MLVLVGCTRLRNVVCKNAYLNLNLLFYGRFCSIPTYSNKGGLYFQTNQMAFAIVVSVQGTLVCTHFFMFCMVF